MVGANIFQVICVFDVLIKLGLWIGVFSVIYAG